jgi:LPS export ABC transporter permease LptG
MRLLDRYLLRELVVPLAYCLGGFLIFLVFADLVTNIGEFQRKQLLFHDIAEYYLVVTPEYLVLISPIALLLALLYALTNHARHHEITAIRAAGISLARLCVPYLAIGFVGSICLFAINELWVPDSADRAERITNRRLPPTPGAPERDEIRNLTFVNSRDGRTWQIGLYRTKSGEMINPQLIWNQPDGSRLWYAAQRAIPVAGVWTFYNVRVHKELARTNTMLIPVLQTNVLAMPELTETPEQIRSEIRIQGAKSVALRKAKKTDIPVVDILNYVRLHPDLPRSDQNWLYTKLHGRLAVPWACLVVVLIAIPFGAASGRRNVYVGVASSIVICFVYYVLQQIGLAVGIAGWVPPWLAAWFPNISFGLTGLFLTSKVR